MYLDAAIDWSHALGLKVIIDLHGAPGSQNGFDNSGQMMDSPQWMADGGFQGGSSQRTLDIISQISQRYAQANDEDVILAIELLNEPRGWTDGTSQDDLRKFYAEGIQSRPPLCKNNRSHPRRFPPSSYLQQVPNSRECRRGSPLLPSLRRWIAIHDPTTTPQIRLRLPHHLR